MSSTIAAAGGRRGTANAIGLLPTIGLVTPAGAITGPVFVIATPISPAAVARSA